MTTARDIDILIQSKDPSTRSGRMARNSLFVLRERWAPSVPPLRIQIGHPGSLTARGVSDISRAVQDATARVAQLILHQSEDRTRLSASIRDRARLISRGQSHNLLLFDFPQSVVSEGNGELPVGHIEHLSELAVRELVQNMPESRDDRAAIEALPGRRQAIRAAVSTLAKVAKDAGDLRIMLDSHAGVPDVSVLTAEQAREVPTLLSNVREESEFVPVEGVLDGMRTRRRLFYLIEPDDRGGQEYEGAIGLDQVDAVQASLQKFVLARLKKTTLVRGDGSRGRAAYSLVDFQVPQQLA